MLFLSQSNRIDIFASIALCSFLTFSLHFPTWENSPFSTHHSEAVFFQAFTEHPTARILSSVFCFCWWCCNFPTVFCQILYVCVSPTRSSALGGQKPNGNLCFVSFGTQLFPACGSIDPVTYQHTCFSHPFIPALVQDFLPPGTILSAPLTSQAR